MTDQEGIVQQPEPPPSAPISYATTAPAGTRRARYTECALVILALGAGLMVPAFVVAARARLLDVMLSRVGPYLFPVWAAVATAAFVMGLVIWGTTRGSGPKAIHRLSICATALNGVQVILFIVLMLFG